MLLAFMGCGREEYAPEKLIGDWEILSVDGEPFAEEEGVALRFVQLDFNLIINTIPIRGFI